jgi:protein TonB
MPSMPGQQPVDDGAAAAAALPGAEARPRPVIVAVTADAELLATLRDAAPDAHVAAVEQPQELAVVLVGRPCDAAFVDLEVVGTATATLLLPNLARQFPDMPIVAIGTRTDEAPIARLISTGEVYRFLHRPLSLERARTFVAAALRRADELRRARPAPDPDDGASARPQVPAAALPRVAPPDPRSIRPASNAHALLFVGTTLAIAAAAAVAWVTRPETPAPPLVDTSAPIADLVGAASAAATAGDLLAPVGASAADLYRLALTRRPDDFEARAALLALSDALLSAGERALAAGRYDEAARAADTVALVRANEPRVRALRLRLDEARLAQSLAALGTAPGLPPVAVARANATTTPLTSGLDKGTAVPDTAATATPGARATGMPAPSGASAAPSAGDAPLRKIADALPEYPAGAKAANVEGWVELVYTVDVQGRTSNVRVLSAEPAGTFDDAAVDAVRRWRYEPLAAPQQANARLYFEIRR